MESHTLQLARHAAAVCALASLLTGCGGGEPKQLLVSSHADVEKYIGHWSSCTPTTDGLYRSGGLTFTSEFEGLTLYSASGSGVFKDVECRQFVPGTWVAYSPATPRHIRMTKTVTIAPESSSQFVGTADELLDLRQFAGFSADYRAIWISPTISFGAEIERYEKN